MDFRTEDARRHYEQIVALAHDTMVGLDFDGTLSPIVTDPTAATIHPDAPAALTALAAHVKAVVVITGRPARQVVELGHFDEVADRLPEGARLLVRGQYGNERWDSLSREFTSTEPPHGLVDLREELPDLLATEDAAGAHVEEKGLAIAVHTRPLPDAKDAFDRLASTLEEAADRHGLSLEPGRLVLEIRAPGMHKGVAVREAVRELEAGAVMFVGDDLGDLEAFEAVESLRDGGMPALLVCSGSQEEAALTDLSDLVVDGPEGVMRVLAALVDDMAPAQA